MTHINYSSTACGNVTQFSFIGAGPLHGICARTAWSGSKYRKRVSLRKSPLKQDPQKMRALFFCALMQRKREELLKIHIDHEEE